MPARRYSNRGAVRLHLTPMTTSLSQSQSRIIAVSPDFIALAGDGNAAIFLTQVLFWWRVAGRKKFYKFNSPCDHKYYRPGDSWLEELCLKRTMFATARRRVAAKVRISCMDEIQSAFSEGALIVYGTDENHLTWYIVNEAALQQRSPAVFARLFESAAPPTPTPSKTPRSPVPPRPAPTPPTTSPAIPAALSQSASSVSAVAATPHSPMQEPCIGIHTESTTKTAPETASGNSLPPLASEDIPLPTHQPSVAGEGGDAKDTIKIIFAGLQERGVQDDPARLIARRAVRAGFSAAETLEIFDAHVLDAQRANAVSPVGVAVARMVKNSQITPAPAWALARVQRRNQECEWAARQRGRDLGESVECAEAVGAIAEQGAEVDESPMQVLWQRVLRDIKLQVTRATYEQQFTGTWLEQNDDGYVVKSQNPCTLEWLAHRLNKLVTNTLKRYAGVDVLVSFA